MNLVGIIGPMNKLEELSKSIGMSGVFHPVDVRKIYKNTENFVRVSTSDPYREVFNIFDNCAKKVKKTFYSVETTGFVPDIYQLKIYVRNFEDKINKFYEKIEKLTLELKNCKEKLADLSHFTSLETSFNQVFSCKYVGAIFGKIPRETYEASSELFGDGLLIKTFSCDNTYFYVLVFFTNNTTEVALIYLNKVNFKTINMPMYGGTVKEEIDKTLEQIEKIKKEIDLCKEKTDKFWSDQQKYLAKIFAELGAMKDYQRAKTLAARYKDKFILAGWVPQNCIPRFTERIKKIKGLRFSVETGDEIIEFGPPVKLENKKFFKPFEFFVTTYGLPVYGETDPTVFVALTYLFLFGIMFADVGQGVVISLAGFTFWWLKKSSLAGILAICGISSAFFGFVFGSVFGFEELLNPLYMKLFGLPGRPIELMEPHTTMIAIYSAIGLGSLLLIVAMVFNVYSLVKKNETTRALFSPNGVCGLIFYCSIIFYVINRFVLKSFSTGTWFLILFLLLPIILMFMGDFLAKILETRKVTRTNWGEYLMDNFFKIFEVILEYFANTVSFVRIAVFMFVHVGMMMVVFTLAKLSGSMYVPVIVIGNIFVTCFEVLLVGIQVMRLEFCELFGRFFKGGGEPFNPVGR